MEFFKANIQFQEVLVQLIAFVIVFWALKKLAWKPILQGLDTRRQRIQDEMDKIEAAKKDIENLRTEYSAHLQKIDEEARMKLQEALDEGRRMARDIQEKARAESQATFEKAKDNLNIEIAKARTVLKREIADLTFMVTEKVLNEKLTGPKQDEKILEMIEELSSGKGDKL